MDDFRLHSLQQRASRPRGLPPAISPGAPSTTRAAPFKILRTGQLPSAMGHKHLAGPLLLRPVIPAPEQGTDSRRVRLYPWLWEHRRLRQQSIAPAVSARSPQPREHSTRPVPPVTAPQATTAPQPGDNAAGGRQRRSRRQCRRRPTSAAAGDSAAAVSRPWALDPEPSLQCGLHRAYRLAVRQRHRGQHQRLRKQGAAHPPSARAPPVPPVWTAAPAPTIRPWLQQEHRRLFRVLRHRRAAPLPCSTNARSASTGRTTFIRQARRPLSRAPTAYAARRQLQNPSLRWALSRSTAISRSLASPRVVRKASTLRASDAYSSALHASLHGAMHFFISP